MSIKVLGYFMETGIFFQGKEQPPRRNNIISMGNTLNFNLDNYDADDEISVLSENGNWYTIKKKEIVLCNAK